MNVYTHLLSAPTFWLLSLIITIAALIPDFVIKVWQMLNLSILPERKNKDKKRASRQSIHHHHQRPVPVFASTINQIAPTTIPTVPMTRISEPIYENVNITQL